MTLTKYSHGVSSFGLPVIGGAFTSTGKVFFVDSNTGSNSYDGRDKTHPFSTIVYANSQCTAGKGDIVYVMPNHRETLTAAGGITLSKNGMSVIGLGNGSLRPLITLASATGAGMLISGDDILFQNIVVQEAITALTLPISITGSDITLQDIEVKTSTSGAGVFAGAGIIQATSDARRLTIDSFIYRETTAETKGVIGFTPSCSEEDGHEIKNCFIMAQATTGGIIHFASTAGVNTGINIHDNVIVFGGCTGEGKCIDLSSGATEGVVARNYLGCNLDGHSVWFGSSTEASYAGMMFFENYCTNLEAESAYLWGNLFTTAST